MAARFIQRSSNAAAARTGNAAGIGVDSDDDLLYFNPAGTRKLVRSADASVKIATTTLTAADSGSTIFLNAATEFVTTLPTPVLGYRLTAIVSAAPSGANYTIVTAASANIIKGAVFSSDLDAAGDADIETSGGDTISFVSAKAVAGDRVEIYCDGTNYFAHIFVSLFDAATITTAS